SQNGMGRLSLLVDIERGQIAAMAVAPGSPVLSRLFGIVMSSRRARRHRLAVLLRGPAISGFMHVEPVQARGQTAQIRREYQAMSGFRDGNRTSGVTRAGGFRLPE